MSGVQVQNRRSWPNRGFFSLLILAATAVISAVLLIVPLTPEASPNQLSLGNVAAQDILAPYSLTYQSEVLTELRQNEAATSVSPQYTQPDPNIARSQLNLLRDVLDYIASVRVDSFASDEQKLADLSAIQAVQLEPDSLTLLLSLTETEWQSVRLEANRLLEQVMRNSIREDQLESVRRGISNQVSLAFNAGQQALVVDLVSDFIIPNSQYSETMTEEQRQAARNAVEPVVQIFVTGETIVSRGQVIAETDVEALEKFGLLRPERTWEDGVGVIALVAISFGFIALYFAQRPDLRSNQTSLLLMALLFVIFLYSGRLIIPNRTIVPYMFPVAGFGMVVAALISSRAAIILTLPLAILTAYNLPNSFELTLFYLFSSAFGILMLRNVYRLLTFFWAGLGATVAGALVIVAFRLSDPGLDAVGFIQLLAATAFHGVAAASLTLILQYLLAQLLGLTTTLQLLEISRPDHPLLQDILRNAPGTYQHSLQIANLAEQAAERIGADTLLTRVGSLYHDAGKVSFPQYFIENQVPGTRNPHEKLPPEESARIIIQHVPDGVELVKKYRLPKRIADFVSEHHGTMMTRYQYANAVKAVDGNAQLIDKALFTYPGPRPRSRETGLVLLADGVEARARAERPNNEAAIRDLVKEIVEHRLSTGQLNDTTLTLNNIETIIESFTTTLRGVYHPRIEYPKLDDSTIKSSGAEQSEQPTKKLNEPE
jgi:putative nucleotidyltransferase with HDIG domain